MSAWLIALVGFIYAYIAADSIRIGHTSLAIVFAGYAFSNIGLWMAAR
jgi:hypothetical protein